MMSDGEKAKESGEKEGESGEGVVGGDLDADLASRRLLGSRNANYDFGTVELLIKL